MTAFLDFLHAKQDAGGLGTEDVLAAFLPLDLGVVHVTVELHRSLARDVDPPAPAAGSRGTTGATADRG